jgi:hypothetical protein
MIAQPEGNLFLNLMEEMQVFSQVVGCCYGIANAQMQLLKKKPVK